MDLLKQLDVRLRSVEDELRTLRSEMNTWSFRPYQATGRSGGFGWNAGGLGSDMRTRFDRLERRFTWAYLLLAVILVEVYGLWLK